jgi:hypothetical protein
LVLQLREREREYLRRQQRERTKDRFFGKRERKVRKSVWWEKKRRF